MDVWGAVESANAPQLTTRHECALTWSHRVSANKTRQAGLTMSAATTSSSIAQILLLLPSVVRSERDVLGGSGAGERPHVRYVLFGMPATSSRSRVKSVGDVLCSAWVLTDPGTHC